MNLSRQITIYKGVSDNKGDEITVGFALRHIQEATLAKQIEKLRKSTDPKMRDKIKKSLLAVTWSGDFLTRKIKDLIAPTGIICLDIDKLEPGEVFTLKELISCDEYTFSCFISPSGNGLKVLVKYELAEVGSTLEQDVERHLAVFLSLEKYYQDKFKVAIDPSGKDISRLCFLSADADIYIHEESKIYSDLGVIPIKEEVKKSAKKIPADKKTPPPSAEVENWTLDQVRDFTDRKKAYVEGQRNEYIHLFACNANRAGHTESDCFHYVCGFADLDQKEIETTVRSAYKLNPGDAGKSKKKFPDAKVQGQKSLPAGKKSSPQDQAADEFKFSKFWFFLKKIDKATGEITEQCKFSYNKCIQFYTEHGFYKIKVGRSYQFVRIENNIIDLVEEHELREFIFSFLIEHELDRVLEMMRAMSGRYLSKGTLEGLHYLRPEFKRDTQHMAFLYFKNCYIEVTKEEQTIKQYADINGHIWKKQVINRDYIKMDYINNPFYQFLQYAICGEILYTDDNDLDKNKKMLSVVASIGYMLHRFKDPTNAKAIVVADKALRHASENNGGSGKSLLAEALKQVINLCTIDGKNFNFNAAFPFQKVDIDHALLNFDDVRGNFDFERLFSLITGDFSFSKKNVSDISIPFEDSPKIYITTNHSLKGFGSSMRRRQHVIEFSNYFSDERRPIDVFKKMFFTQWDPTDWNGFFSFISEAITVYLNNGLVEFPLENYGMNKILDQCGEEFVDIMEEEVFIKLLEQNEYKTKELFMKFLESVKGMHREKTQQNTFTKYIKMWAEEKGLLVNAHVNGERVRRNSIDYITFTKKPEKKDGTKTSA